MRPAMTQLLGAAVTAVLCVTAARAEQVGEVGVDWVGNDIIIEALTDRGVGGVTCHLAYFERGLIDRLTQGNWFEDPSNSAIECQQTGPINLDGIDRDRNGEDVFRASRSIIFKTLRVKRIYDERNNTLVYLAHSQELSEGSAKVSISSVPVRDFQK